MEQDRAPGTTGTRFRVPPALGSLCPVTPKTHFPKVPATTLLLEREPLNSLNGSPEGQCDFVFIPSHPL